MSSTRAQRSVRTSTAARKRSQPSRSHAKRSSTRSLWGWLKPKNLRKTIAHLILPSDRNSRRAKLLHPDSLAVIAVFTGLVHISMALYLNFPVLPDVLGKESPITQEQVLSQVNQERENHGLSPLATNLALTQAAEAKARDMLSQNYWSHLSPEGKEPWDFIEDTGYEYSVAGENLARNFSNAQRMTAAWMASPTHRANILHTQYQETGIAVIEGPMNGKSTTLVVQMFSTPADAVVVPVANLPDKAVAATRLIANTIEPSPNILGVQDTFEPLQFYRFGILVILAVLVGVLVLDMVHASKKKMQRNTGRGLAHLTLLFAVMATVALAERGSLL